MTAVVGGSEMLTPKLLTAKAAKGCKVRKARLCKRIFRTPSIGLIR